MTQDIAGRDIVQAKEQGQYAVVDITLATTNVTWIDQLTGRQGDDGRLVSFAIKNGKIPYSLDNTNIELMVKDAQGAIKVGATVTDMVSSVGGLFKMLIPAEFYQAAGDVEEAYLRFTKNDTSVVTTVNVGFRVLANGLVVTAGASKLYLQSIDQLISDANEKIGQLTADIESAASAANAARIIAQQVLDQIKVGLVPGLNTDNYYNGNNTFVGDVAVRGKANMNDLVVNGTATVSEDVVVNGKSFLDLTAENTDTGWVDLPLITAETSTSPMQIATTGSFRIRGAKVGKHFGVQIISGVVTADIILKANGLYGIAKVPDNFEYTPYHPLMATAGITWDQYIGYAVVNPDGILYVCFPRNDIPQGYKITVYDGLTY